VFAREVARQAPGHIDRVITLGSALVGGAKYTTAAEQYRARGVDLDAAARRLDVMARANPLTMPVTSIYSRTDNVVAWRASIDPYGDTTHIEVHTSHAGLMVSPEVAAHVARRLV
jgi:hypothetical protein